MGVCIQQKHSAFIAIIVYKAAGASADADAVSVVHGRVAGQRSSEVLVRGRQQNKYPAAVAAASAVGPASALLLLL